MKLITEKTALPIGLVITLCGGIVWLTSVYYTGVANSSEIKELKLNQQEEFLQIKRSLDDIRERLSRIEGRLETP